VKNFILVFMVLASGVALAKSAPTPVKGCNENAVLKSGKCYAAPVLKCLENFEEIYLDAEEGGIGMACKSLKVANLFVPPHFAVCDGGLLTYKDYGKGAGTGIICVDETIWVCPAPYRVTTVDYGIGVICTKETEDFIAHACAPDAQFVTVKTKRVRFHSIQTGAEIATPTREP
jgi:hypothetical protein